MDKKDLILNMFIKKSKFIYIYKDRLTPTVVKHNGIEWEYFQIRFKQLIQDGWIEETTNKYHLSIKAMELFKEKTNITKSNLWKWIKRTGYILGGLGSLKGLIEWREILNILRELQCWLHHL